MTKPNAPRDKSWSMALCPSGKILEIKEGIVPATTMLPPCSNQDLPEWVSVIEMSAYEKLREENDRLASELIQLTTEHPCYRLSKALEVENKKLCEALKHIASRKPVCAGCTSPDISIVEHQTFLAEQALKETENVKIKPGV